MKAWSMFAAIGVMVGLVGLVACGGEKNSGSSEKQAAAPLTVKPAKENAAANSVPAEKMNGKDAPAGAAQKQAPFSAEMSAEFMRKVMETSARIDGVKKQIAERQKVIYETNPEVKAYRSQLIELQGEVNKIMNADADLAELKLNRDILWTTMPTLPRGNAQQGGGPARGFGPMR